MGAAFVVIPDDPTDPDNWLYTKSLIVDAGFNEIIGMTFSWHCIMYCELLFFSIMFADAVNPSLHGQKEEGRLLAKEL